MQNYNSADKVAQHFSQKPCLVKKSNSLRELLGKQSCDTSKKSRSISFPKRLYLFLVTNCHAALSRKNQVHRPNTLYFFLVKKEHGEPID